MLETKKLSKWLDFEHIIEWRLHTNITKIPFYQAPYLYRGQADSNWDLITTLERYQGMDKYMSGYHQEIYDIKSQLETFTSHKWNLPDLDLYQDRVLESGKLLDDQITAYMIYLRHFGYPSPLLDWSLSPYVAAYFAFRDVSNKAESVAIFEFFAGDDLWKPVLRRQDIDSNPHIYPITGSGQTNNRHYLQQGIYTICLRKVAGHIVYSNHEAPSITNSSYDESHFAESITKYVIPASERYIALNFLESYNINSYSLVGSEESLLETMYLKNHKGPKISIDP